MLIFVEQRIFHSYGVGIIVKICFLNIDKKNLSNYFLTMWHSIVSNVLHD